MSEQTLSEKLSDQNVALRLDQVPDTIVQTAKLHILDSIGCLLAGARLDAGELAYDYAIKASGAPGPHATVTLFGTDSRVSYNDAVQAMSTAAHCGEMDDIHSGAGTCIGGMIVPALLAMAEKFGGAGRKFIESVIVGYETTARIGLAINAPSLFAHGWWPSTVCGALGVVAAGAKFLGWPADKTANALGVAALHAGGMITGGNEGATARHLVFGRAAQNGIQALAAAEQGFTGPTRAFEDQRGFCLTVCNDPRWEFLQNSGQFHLSEVAFKPYPCARQLHAGVEALLRLIRQYSIEPAMIEGLTLSVPSANASIVNRPLTTYNRAATLGSGQYVLAVTALRGKIDLASFEEEFLRSDDVQKLAAKTKVRSETELDRHFPRYWAGRVSITLADGRSVTDEVIIPKGETGNPMTQQEVEEKFLSLAAPSLNEAKARSIIKEINVLPSRESLEPLLSFLRL
jgi:2-methylcitrate dehydratase PrpD